MSSVSPEFRLKSLVDLKLEATPLNDSSGKRITGGIRIKQMRDGALWLTDLDKMHVFKRGASVANGLQKVCDFSAPFKGPKSEGYSITSFTDFFASPVIALGNKHLQNQNNPDFIECGLVQVDYSGKLDCIISRGPFSHVTSSRFDPRLISGIRGYNQVSLYEYDETNNGNKWIHKRDLFLEKAYSRHQLGSETILLGGKDGTHIDEYSIKEEDFGTFIGSFAKATDTPADNGMYLCCLDYEETTLVADMPNNSLYIREKGKEKLERLNVDIADPHDAATFNGKLVVSDKSGCLFELEVVEEGCHGDLEETVVKY